MAISTIARGSDWSPDRRFSVLVGIESLLAAIAGFLFLGNKSLWFDEGITAQIVGLDWGPFWRLLSESEGMQGLYYLSLRLWLWLSPGSDEVVLRAPSVLAAAIAVVGVAMLGRELFSARVGLTAGLLLALNPFFIQFAQEARGYEFAAALITFASYMFVRMVREPRRRWVVGYILLSALSAYAHLFALLVVGVHLLSLTAMPRSSLSLRTLGLIMGAIGILLAPLGLFVVTTSDLHISWVPSSDLYDLARHFAKLTGSRWLLLFYVPVASLPVLLMLYRRDARERLRLEWPLVFVSLWLIAPTIAVFIVSYIVPMFVSRYLIVTLPALVLLLAVGLSQFRPRWIAAATLAFYALLSVSGLGEMYERPKEDWRDATEYISSAAHPGDVIVFNRPEVGAVYSYYRKELRADPQTAPTLTAFQLPAPQRTSAIIKPTSLFRISNPRILPLEATPHERVWLVLSHDAPASSEMIVNTLGRTLKFSGERSFAPGIRVLLFDSREVSVETQP